MFGGGVGTDVTEPFTETMESSGERSLISRRLFTIIRFARVVGHAFDTRDDWCAIAAFRRPQGRADLTDCFTGCQESVLVR